MNAPLLVSLALLMPLACAHAAEQERPFKLTTGAYRFSDRTTGIDLNLRHSSSLGNLWVGLYRQPEGSESPAQNQWRGGWDHVYGDTVRLIPSVQLASGGFVGGSLNVETGQRWVVGAGLGRTNQRPYYNLNFDPNDAYMLSLGWRGEHGRQLTLSMVHDNRDNPDQIHRHLVYRTPLGQDGARLTIDLLRKTGQVAGQGIAGTGLSLTYDRPHWFVRIAWDPYTNFGPEHSLRLATGWRF